MSKTNSITIKLPFPPSSNHVYMHRAMNCRGGKNIVTKFLSQEGKDYKAIVCKAIKGLCCDVMTKDVCMKAVLVVKDKRARDTDNYSKVLHDAVTESGIINDDSQIVSDTVIKKLSDKKEHFLILTITEAKTDVFGVAERKKKVKRGKRKVVKKKKGLEEFLKNLR